jgi:hypothetical protein
MTDQKQKPNIVRVELYGEQQGNGLGWYKVIYDKDPMDMEKENIEAGEYITFRLAKDELEVWLYAQKTLDIVFDKIKDK